MIILYNYHYTQAQGKNCRIFPKFFTYTVESETSQKVQSMVKPVLLSIFFIVYL